MGNFFKTAFLLSALTLFFIFIGQLAGGTQGAAIAFFIAVCMNFFSYWFSSDIILKMYSAKPIQESQNPELYRIVHRLSRDASVQMPQICIINNDTPNAFATGRNPAHGVIAVTTGLLRILNKDELEGVLAHEISHINNRDILLGSVAATISGAVMLIANMLRFASLFGGSDRENNPGISGFVIAIVAPIAALIIQMAVSRTREYQADADAARLTKKPMALASALQKLSVAARQIPMNASPATAHMFIINPLSAKNFADLFSTHPDIEDRIKRLKAMDNLR